MNLMWPHPPTRRAPEALGTRRRGMGCRGRAQLSMGFTGTHILHCHHPTVQLRKEPDFPEITGPSEHAAPRACPGSWDPEESLPLSVMWGAQGPEKVP